MLFLTHTYQIKRPHSTFGVIGQPLVMNVAPDVDRWALEGHGMSEYGNLDLVQKDEGIEAIQSDSYNNRFIIFDTHPWNQPASSFIPSYRHCRLQFFKGRHGGRILPEILAFDEVDGYLNYVALRVKSGDIFCLVYDGHKGDDPRKHMKFMYHMDNMLLNRVNMDSPGYLCDSFRDRRPPFTFGNPDRFHLVSLEESEWVDIRP